MRNQTTVNGLRSIVLAALAFMTLAGCFSAREVSPPPPLGSPTPVDTGPIPSGRPAENLARFDGEPCAVATAEELAVALSGPFRNLSGTRLTPDGKPRAVNAGCDFGFLAEGTDTAEMYHFVRILLRRADDGAAKLADCAKAARKAPLGAVQAGDEACLNPGSMLVLRNGELYFTIAMTVQPPRADRRDEDAELAPMVKAAAVALAARLPVAR